MHTKMRVYLSFDIEIWCNSWEDLDGRFPSAFERYVYGRSAKGEYALPKTLEILDRHGLKGVFFIEPLFAARFGVAHLETIVQLIRAGGHDIELHLHPEWADEIRPLPFPGAVTKRQHLSYYSLEEQITLIKLGLDLLAQVGCSRINAFRTGSFACNADTFRALRACGISVDGSLNEVHPDCGVDLRGRLDLSRAQVFEGVTTLPMTVFRDGTGRLRPAQVGACSFAEFRAALDSAFHAGVEHFMVLSHNFEMLKQAGSEPDAIVVRRFEALCRHLAENRDRYTVETLDVTPLISTGSEGVGRPVAGLGATLLRHGEQLARKFLG